ncbi:unnamed protein product [Heligmosomoides polygyrus]|uniref:DUF4139 domain-containing protein n=1 Tax=Heligmosomoides polygyrus TaxID=6339 RepID=A0A3P7TRZ3_HELPZ|nr:unnamed protein product [Heligmosomoides polygyrus]
MIFRTQNSFQLRDVNKSLEKSERELNALQQELNRAESDVFHVLTYCSQFRSIIITLESEKGGPIELEVSYQVHGASWRPSYDLRVDTRVLQITYFGSITQSTNEDWNNVLSTAQPCLGGQIPELGVLEAVFYRPPPAAAPRPCFGVSSCRSLPPSTFAFSFENALSTEFVIAKPAAIPSDGAEHKVTIGIVDLSPQFVHECVPSKNTSTFLTASAVNSSSLPFLPGDTAVYLNSSFVAKTQMKNVSPGERFSCSLGVDTAVRVEYKPVKKYHEQLGIINKTSSTVYEQIIIVKNSRAEPILLTVKEHIPRSTDEKIKVSSVPIYRGSTDQSGGISGGILEWTITAHDGKSAELHVKYAVEHPKDETIEFVERH